VCTGAITAAGGQRGESVRGPGPVVEQKAPVRVLPPGRSPGPAPGSGRVSGHRPGPVQSV